jgi:hypothetical protein
MTGLYNKSLREFNLKFNPKIDYRKLLLEEFNEWWIEMTFNNSPVDELKELCDVIYVAYGIADRNDWVIKPEISVSTNNYRDDIVYDYATFLNHQCQESLQYLIESVITYGKSRGWDVEEAFKRVHQSNLSKLDDNGKPVLNADGKLIKGPNYKKPYLEDLIKVPLKPLTKA